MNLTFDVAVAGDLAVAALAGLAVGIEREWSGHATGPGARFAGARTMLLLGILGGLAGWCFRGEAVLPGTLFLTSGIAITVAAYIMAARTGPSIEGTTEVAALVVLAVGAVAGFGFPLLTSAIVSVMVLALIEKTRIQSAISRLGEREMAAALQFAVLALVVLPVLPPGPYGPFDAIRPRALWTAVLMFSGLNFAAYLARRMVGDRNGYAIAGMLGGAVSSTAVTLQFSHKSQTERALGEPLAIGAVGASVVLVPRVLVVTAALNPRTATALIPYLLPALVLGVVGLAALLLLRGPGERADRSTDERSPLGLWTALKMTLAFQVVLLLVPYIKTLWGANGVVASAAVLGLADTDALTFAMARLQNGEDAVALGAKAIAVGILANAMLKLTLTLVLGAGKFRRITAIGLLALAAAAAAGLWLA